MNVADCYQRHARYRPDHLALTMVGGQRLTSPED